MFGSIFRGQFFGGSFFFWGGVKKICFGGGQKKFFWGGQICVRYSIFMKKFVVPKSFLNSEN